MDGIFILLGLVALAVPVVIIILLVGQSNLRHRVNALERALSGLSAVGAVAPAREISADASVTLPEFSIDNLHELAPQVPAPTPVSAASTAAVSPWDRARSVVSADAPQPAPPIAARQPSGPSPLTRLAGWLKLNWVYAISAASLALAGVFFVQYGIEQGLLPPRLRVLVAICFGGCLILAAEWMRRRHGDGEAVSTAYLPSVFAGAGLVSIFAAVLSARVMYGLIGPQTAFAGHVLTAGLAIGLGWIYGPLLVSVGLLGAAAAPFIVAGEASAEPWLYAYFGLIGFVGLAVDTLRRWAWVSVLALVLAYGGGLLSLWAGAGEVGWIVLLIVLAVLAVIVPDRSLIPHQEGVCLTLAAAQKGKLAVSFPVKLAAGAAVASTVALTMMAGAQPSVAVLAYGALVLLALAYLLWAEKADGLADLAFAPALGLWVMLFQQGFGGLALARDYAAAAIRAPEVVAPTTVTLLLGLAVLVSGAFALRSFRGGALAVAYGLAAVLVAPVAAVIFELLWHPALVMGAYPWALHVIALAGVVVALAVRYAAQDADKRRVAYATLSALSLIALALFLVTTKTALTLALAVLALVAAVLDRRFKLPEMGWFIQLAVAVLGYRLLADPGLEWAFDAPIGQVLLAFGGVIAALIAALRILPDERILPKGVLESAAAGFTAILATVVISRLILRADMRADGDTFTHWGGSLQALPWLVLMLMQIYRARLGGPLVRLRQAVALVAGGLAAAGLALAVSLNPLSFYSPTVPGALVLGPMVLDTLFLAYAVPGLLLVLAAWKMPGLGRLRLATMALGAAFAALYTGLEVRRFWQGDWLGGSGVVQGELYSYTLALMLLGAILLYQAIAKRSDKLRRVAMIVIGLTIAKVFLLDAAGLTGLTRVVSFLGLGLSLAGLAWLNRWAGQVSEK